MGRLEGQVAIVTGASGGIGCAICCAFAREGCDIAACDAPGVSLDAVVGMVEGLGRRVLVESFDLRIGDAVRGFVGQVGESFGKVSIVVHNAAIMPVVAIEHASEAQVFDTFGVNLFAAITMSAAATSFMRSAGGGSIIYLSSGLGHYGIAEHALYSATKSGLMGLCRSQAMELAPDGIRVNTISPGTIDTPMLARFIDEAGGDPIEARAAFDRMHPRGVIGRVEEVASVAVFLASDESANITATDIRCDGGLAVKGEQPVRRAE
ncbi:MAG: SDR family oxidoreductase [Planctomycetota bacterium]